MDEVQKKILSSLQNLCARQECCTRDLLSKAQKALATRDGYIAAPDAAQSIVASLVEDGYADDRRYSAAFAREKSSQLSNLKQIVLTVRHCRSIQLHECVCLFVHNCLLLFVHVRGVLYHPRVSIKNDFVVPALCHNILFRPRNTYSTLKKPLNIETS